MKNLHKIFTFGSLVLALALHMDGQIPAEALVDERDGQLYETVRIGDQIWMARNLNYGSESRTCYEADMENCLTYGALYTWEEARDVCPAGWLLPSKEHWERLSEYLGVADAGQKLKASRDDAIPWDGTNETGFNALPAGAGNGEGFQRMGDWALFWCSTESSAERAWFAQLDGYWYQAPPKYTNLYLGSYYLKSNQFSVRCIKDPD